MRIIPRLVTGTAALAALAAPAGSLAAQGMDNSAFDSLLTRFVQDGRVDYAALKERRTDLDRYLDQLAAVGSEDFASWPEPYRIAYLINAYNAYTLETIIDHYPIEGSGFFEKLLHPKRFAFPSSSIRQIDGAFDGITHRVAGADLTLDEIEHGRLRSNYSEPRIHFALVCAAVSCPPLRRESYRGDRIGEQLDDQGRRFLNDPALNRFDPEGGVIHLSKIFDWFREDFRPFVDEGVAYEGDAGVEGALAFVRRYLPDPIVRFIEKGDYEVDFLPYDWTLNDRPDTATR